jgi:hypothetical protein
MRLRDLIDRVRFQIGDPAMPFRTTALGDGQTVWYDLPKQEINRAAVLAVTVVDGAVQTVLVDFSYAPQWSSTVTYAIGQQVQYELRYYTALESNINEAPVSGGNSYWSDGTATAYDIDAEIGQVFLGQPVPINATLIITGCAWSLFSNDELAQVAIDSVRQHTYGQEIEERYRDAHGFIAYRETPKSLANLPGIEEPLVEMLSVINALWSLANDAASDTNVQTAEGTVVDRTTRYRQIMEQVQAMTMRYQDYCGQLNVGLYRSETLQLRRVSYTTGRLVPLFKSREYDDHRWPVREIPPVDHRYDDNSGVPSPLWTGNWGGF